MTSYQLYLVREPDGLPMWRTLSPEIGTSLYRAQQDAGIGVLWSLMHEEGYRVVRLHATEIPPLSAEEQARRAPPPPETLVDALQDRLPEVREVDDG